MREFFRGWKRKVGLVVLAIACLFVGGWVRSLSTVDFILWHRFDKTCNVVSGRGRFLVLVGPRNFAQTGILQPTDRDARFPINLRMVPLQYEDVIKRRKHVFSMIHWKASNVFVRFAVDRFSSQDSDIEYQMIPYWIIVLPLT